MKDLHHLHFHIELGMNMMWKEPGGGHCHLVSVLEQGTAPTPLDIFLHPQFCVGRQKIAFLTMEKMPFASGSKAINYYFFDARLIMSILFKDIQIRNIIAAIILPSVGVWLSIDTPFVVKTKVWTLMYYFITGIGKSSFS